MELRRRSFLKGMGALGGIATTGAGFDAIAQAAKPAKATAASKSGEKPLDVKHVKSGCAICPNFCGIDATVVNGIVRTIYPDAARAEFYNHGICPKGASGMFNTYDPYRLKKPLKRTNPKKGRNENPRWVEISWEEAFKQVSAQLARIRADNPSKLVWHHGQGKYLIQEQFARPSPRRSAHPTWCIGRPLAKRHAMSPMSSPGRAPASFLTSSTRSCCSTSAPTISKVSRRRAGSTGRPR